MSTRTRYALSPMPVTDVALFHSSEEAWFWFIRCQLMRYQGVQPTSTTGALVRPCDPDDIYRAVTHLHQQRHLSAEHLRTLSQYGLAERTPDERCPEEAGAARLWREAMGCLETRLVQKGIVATPANDSDLTHYG